MAGILPEYLFVEVLDGGFSVGVIGDNAGPVVVTAVTGGPLSEPLELTCGVASVVPAVASAAFPCPAGSARGRPPVTDWRACLVIYRRS